MKRKLLWVVATVLVIAVLSFSVVYLLNAGRSEREFEQFKNGVLFTSDVGMPLELLGEFSQRELFFISPQLTTENSTLNAEISNNFFLPAIVVIAGNDKNAVSLARVFSGTELLQCETNMGNPKTRVTLPAGECLSLANREQGAVFIAVDFPTEGNSPEEILIGENFIEIKAKSFPSLNSMVLVLLGELFPNAREVIDSSNEAIGGLGFA